MEAAILFTLPWKASLAPPSSQYIRQLGREQNLPTSRHGKQSAKPVVLESQIRLNLDKKQNEVESKWMVSL